MSDYQRHASSMNVRLPTTREMKMRYSYTIVFYGHTLETIETLDVAICNEAEPMSRADIAVKDSLCSIPKAG